MPRRKEKPAARAPDNVDERAAHRAAMDSLQAAIDATMGDGDGEAAREGLRQAREREQEAHDRLQRSRRRRPPGG